MNHIHPCFWSLIDNDDFNVLYASRSIPDDIRSIFMSRSLFDLLHPDEADLARHDLKRFVQTSPSTGSVTRCRLRNFVGYKPSSDAPKLPGMSNSEWLIVDVIVYAATDQLLLAFFHLDPGSLTGRHTNACGEHFFDGAYDIEHIRNLLHHHHHPTIQHLDQQQRYLHIVESRTKTAVLSWPELYHHEKSLTALAEARVGTASCFDSSRHSSRDVSPNGTLAIADHIIIPYGCITFIMTTTTQSSLSTTTTLAQNNSVHIAVEHQQQEHRFHLSSSYNDHLQHNNNRLPSLHHLPHLAEEPIFGSQAQQNHMGPNTAISTSTTTTTTSSNYQNVRPIIETSHFSPSRSSSTTTSTSSPISTKRRYSRCRDSFESMGLPSMDHTKPFIPYARRNVSNTSSATPSSSHSYYRSPPNTTAPMYHQRHSPPPSASQHQQNKNNNLTAAHAHVRKRRHSSSARQQQQQQQHSNNHQNSASVVQNRCESCGTDSSPEWRKGPSGHKTLCNACGLRWKRSLTRKEKQQQQQNQQQSHSNSFPGNITMTTTANTFPMTTTTTTPRYSAPSSPVSSCSSSSSSSSSSASSSSTSLADPMTPHHYTSSTSICHKSFYDQLRYDPIHRY